jgi:hypothetical protein
MKHTIYLLTGAAPSLLFVAVVWDIISDKGLHFQLYSITFLTSLIISLRRIRAIQKSKRKW